MLPPLRALLFDFDGLILDTESPEMALWGDIFREHGVEFPKEYWSWAVGRGAEQIGERPADILERLTGRHLDKVEIEGDYRERRMRAILAKEPQPGIVPLIREACDAGRKLAVVSSSRHAWVDTHLERLGLAGFFDATVCADDTARAKPFPDLYLLALERLGARAEEAVAFEDSPNGTRAAVDAGIFCFAVPNAVTQDLDLSHASLRLETLGGVTLAEVERMRRPLPA